MKGEASSTMQSLLNEWMSTSEETLRHLLLTGSQHGNNAIGGGWDSVQKQLYALFDAKYARYALLSALPKHMQDRMLEEELLKYYARQMYQDGTMCPVRPGFRRRSEIVLECGAETKITDILEPQVSDAPSLPLFFSHSIVYSISIFL